jgi:hypothetical protein
MQFALLALRQLTYRETGHYPTHHSLPKERSLEDSGTTHLERAHPSLHVTEKAGGDTTPLLEQIADASPIFSYHFVQAPYRYPPLPFHQGIRHKEFCEGIQWEHAEP